MIGMSTMGPEATAIFFVVGLACFVLAAIGTVLSPRVTLGWLGLALITVPPTWNSIAAT